MLKAARIEVSLGLMKEQAEQVNRFFFHRIKHKRPFVTLKLAASLDGKTALANGDSKWITSPQARKDVQRYRAGACAILTGADTVIADNPQLNVREQELPTNICEQFSWRSQQPLRVVLDSQNRLQANKYQIFQDGHPTLVYNKAYNPRLADKYYHLLGQQQLVMLQSESREYLNLRAVLEDLGSKGINHCWVEAGETLSGALLELSLVDRLILYQAPKILGHGAKGLSRVKPKSALSEAIEGNILSVDKIGPDIKTIIEFSH
jgi:diaminohydroxyphosphoribosylaminopyrimidine deaminase/5-amino-6-(5-phosphoribosylamino)uracil reductase